MTPEEIYTKLYLATEDQRRHPTKGVLDPYGSDDKRDVHFLKYLADNFGLEGQRILDASCGRGHLLRSLLAFGYQAEGTEFVDCLFKTELADLPVKKLAYQDLSTIEESGIYDAVISNDVLEHLPGPKEAIEAMEQLARLSNNLLLISIGVGRAPKFGHAFNTGWDLHTVKESERWWAKRASKVMDIDYQERFGGSVYLFGKVKGRPS